MPTITLPLRGRGRRRGRWFADFGEARADETRKAATDLTLPTIDWSKLDPSRLDLSKLDLSKLDLPARAEIAKQVRKASKDQFRRASKEINNALPRRGPSPLPFAILAAIGGLFVGWILATSPSARSTIERGFDSARRGMSGMVAGMTAPSEEPDMAAWSHETRTPVASDTYAAAIGAQRDPVSRETA